MSATYHTNYCKLPPPFLHQIIAHEGKEAYAGHCIYIVLFFEALTVLTVIVHQHVWLSCHRRSRYPRSTFHRDYYLYNVSPLVSA